MIELRRVEATLELDCKLPAEVGALMGHCPDEPPRKSVIGEPPIGLNGPEPTGL